VSTTFVTQLEIFVRRRRRRGRRRRRRRRRRKCKESLLRPSLQFSLILVSRQLLDRLTHREFPAENCQLLS